MCKGPEAGMSRSGPWGGVNCVSHICADMLPQASGGGYPRVQEVRYLIRTRCRVRAVSSGAPQSWI